MTHRLPEIVFDVIGSGGSQGGSSGGIVTDMSDPLTGCVRVEAVCLFTSADRLLAIDDFDSTEPGSF